MKIKTLFLLGILLRMSVIIFLIGIGVLGYIIEPYFLPIWIRITLIILGIIYSIITYYEVNEIIKKVNLLNK